ncbi:MAG: RNA polymerase subunit sigma-70, partial [Rhodopirellula bahusiensis]
TKAVKSLLSRARVSLKEALTPYIESGQLGGTFDPAMSMPSMQIERSTSQTAGEMIEEEPS